ncbi:MAG: thermonuclease family protein [Candidatus Omnitrophota bacterium]
MNKKSILLSIAAAVALIGYLFSGNTSVNSFFQQGSRPSVISGKNFDYNNALIIRVVDGDTLVLENKEKVRLIGIDTPEMHESAKLDRDAVRSGQSKEVIRKLGRQSYQFTRGLVEGKRVRLEFDKERYDRYNRVLAYVYLLDGTFVNAKIIQDGFASVMRYPPNVLYADLFLKLYQEARENKRGLWQ